MTGHVVQGMDYSPFGGVKDTEPLERDRNTFAASFWLAQSLITPQWGSGRPHEWDSNAALIVARWV